jgi:uncharacterized integral membrane protein
MINLNKSDINVAGRLQPVARKTYRRRKPDYTLALIRLVLAVIALVLLFIFFPLSEFSFSNAEDSFNLGIYCVVFFIMFCLLLYYMM